MKKINRAFTLIELMLVIGIISIIAIWSSWINFNRLSDKQKIEIFSNKIITLFEKVRNNSLLWKGIWTNMQVPEKWKIEFSNAWNWQILTSYYLSWATDWTIYDNNVFDTLFEIKELECTNINNTNTESILNWTWTIEINWSKLSLNWDCTDISHKKIITTVRYKNNFEEKIEINTINWLINKL